MKILELFNLWTKDEKKQALASMPLFRRIELAKAFIAAGWTPSVLIAAGWTSSNFIAAGWTPSNFIAAGWRLSDLMAAGWAASDVENLEDFESDIKAKAKKMGKEEAAFIIDSLNRGLMDGSGYGTLDSCGCFLGTAAKKAGKSVDEYCRMHKILKDVKSPAEKWFMTVCVGDIPENNFAAKMGVKWISEAIREQP